MTGPRSLRTRILLGALLAIAGLMIAVPGLSSYLVRYHPEVLHAVHFTLIFSIAGALMLAGLTQLRRGLSPFTELRSRLASVREGKTSHIDGSYPTEVQPLVDDLNAVLLQRETLVTQALAKAGDLAHGLKTPLAILFREAELADASGNAELAAAIRHQVERMQRQIEHHLAHARAAVSGATPGLICSVAESADGLARAMRRLHAERGLAIATDIPPGCFVKGRREDLDEMLGNLLDNACKWATTEIHVQAVASEPGWMLILVDDDGPGLDASMREAVLQRGVRADEAAPGSGFGLAIVRDLASLYGGSIYLAESPTGGLRASLRLPSP